MKLAWPCVSPADRAGPLLCALRAGAGDWVFVPGGRPAQTAGQELLSCLWCESPMGGTGALAVATAYSDEISRGGRSGWQAQQAGGWCPRGLGTETGHPRCKIASFAHRYTSRLGSTPIGCACCASLAELCLTWPISPWLAKPTHLNKHTIRRPLVHQGHQGAPLYCSCSPSKL